MSWLSHSPMVEEYLNGFSQTLNQHTEQKEPIMNKDDLLWIFDRDPNPKNYKPKSYGLDIINEYSVGIIVGRYWRYWRRYSVSIDEIVYAGLTEEDAAKLNSLGWCLDLRRWEIYCIDK